MTPDDYILAVGQRLEAAGARLSTAQLPQGAALVGHRSQFRLRWLGTRLHLLTVLVPAASATGPGLEDFANDVLDYAAAQERVFRGLQVWLVAVPVIVAEHAVPSAIEFASTTLVPEFGKVARFGQLAKLAWPTLVDLSTGQVHSHQGRVLSGAIFAGWIRKQIAATLPDPRSL